MKRERTQVWKENGHIQGILRLKFQTQFYPNFDLPSVSEAAKIQSLRESQCAQLFVFSLQGKNGTGGPI